MSRSMKRWLPRPRDAYGRTKLRAEELVLEADGRAGMRTTALRIPLVYGEGMKANMLKLFKLVESQRTAATGFIAHHRRTREMDVPDSRRSRSVRQQQHSDTQVI
jgi:nucleoside-diphosphate-sugar epimerase